MIQMDAKKSSRLAGFLFPRDELIKFTGGKKSTLFIEEEG